MVHISVHHPNFLELQRKRVVLLIGCSMFFYGWWYPPYLVLLITSISINFVALKYFLGLGKDAICSLIVLVNLGLLFYFKYFGFFLENLAIFGLGVTDYPEILLPLAISFFTFQQIAFAMDVKRGIVQSYSVREYFLFVVFFLS